MGWRCTDEEHQTFTETSFAHSNQFKLADDKWVDYVSMNGSMSINGKMMNVIITTMGDVSINWQTGVTNGEIINYNTGSAEFDNLIAKYWGSKSFSLEYSVSGNLLTLKMDINGDGDFLEEGEIGVYTKQ